MLYISVLRVTKMCYLFDNRGYMVLCCSYPMRNNIIETSHKLLKYHIKAWIKLLNKMLIVT